MKSQMMYVSLAQKKGAIGAFSNFRYVDLTTETLNILGCHHSYNRQLAENRKFIGLIFDIQNILCLWSIESLSLPGKIQFF